MTEQTTPVAVPSITGNPVLDTAIKALIMTLGASASTLLISYLSAHGINDANLNAQIPVLVTAVLVLLATIGAGVWAVVSKRQTVNAVVTNAMEAAETGVVPDAVKAIATLDQKTAIDLSASASGGPSPKT